MDYVGGVLLFVIGFLAAFLVARGWRFRRSKKVNLQGILDKGAVRLDLLDENKQIVDDSLFTAETELDREKDEIGVGADKPQRNAISRGNGRRKRIRPRKRD